MRLQLLLFTGILFFTSVAKAQENWTVGERFGGFIGNDLRTGKEYDLKRDYLDKGTALFVVSAADWENHSEDYYLSGALEMAHEQYGVAGTHEVQVILFNGEGMTRPFDWLHMDEAPYPLLASGNMGVPAFPHMFIVCPTEAEKNAGKVADAGQYLYRASQIVRAATENCGSLPISSGHNLLDAAVRLGGSTEEYCSADALKAEIVCLGSKTINSAQVDLLIDGEIVQTEYWAGNLQTGEVAEVDFDIFPDSESELKVAFKVTTYGDEISENNRSDEITLKRSPLVSFTGSTDIIVRLTPDAWGEEITWELRNGNGEVVLSGGPYENHLEQDSEAEGGWKAFLDRIEIDEQQLTVNSDGQGCYSFYIEDSGSGGDGDGIANPGKEYWGVGKYEVIHNGEVLVSGGDFGKSEEKLIEVSAGPSSSGARLNLNSFGIYPNPASNFVHVSVHGLSNVQLEVINLLGEVVMIEKLNKGTTSLDVSSLRKGNYYVRVVTAEGVLTKKLMLQ